MITVNKEQHRRQIHTALGVTHTPHPLWYIITLLAQLTYKARDRINQWSLTKTHLQGPPLARSSEFHTDERFAIDTTYSFTWK